MKRRLRWLVYAALLIVATVELPRLAPAQNDAGSAAPATSTPTPDAPAASTAPAPAPPTADSSAGAASPAPTPAQQAPVPIEGAKPVSATGPVLRELSPWSMFMSADILVQAVIVSLAFASLVSWTIFLAITMKLFIARRRLQRALARIRTARSLAEAQMNLGASKNVVSALLQAALHEIRVSPESSDAARIQERAASSFAEIARAEARSMRVGMSALATIGSTAPFVGLFGTVWGIMNSFIGISKAQTTNLAVVAPGIAEALLATAIGLVAAIPAVMIYNHFSRATRGYMDLVGRGSGTVGRLLSRDLDRAHSVLSRAAE
jgi:biopolymer transport protein ExbB